MYMYKKIEDASKVDLSDTMITIVNNHGEGSVDACIIYHCGEYDEPITLADIKTKYPDVRLVISENPLDGKVFRYGNHGEFWEQIGETIGYA